MYRRETLSSQTIQAYVARGRSLQAEALRGAFAAAFRPVRRVVTGLAAVLLSGARVLRLWRCRRVALRELQSLDDRMLKDIGVPRGQILHVVDSLLRDPADRPAPRSAEVLPLRRGATPEPRKELAA